MSRIIMMFIVTLIVIQKMGYISVANIDLKEISVEQAVEENKVVFEDTEETKMQEPPEFPEFGDGETWELPIEINPELLNPKDDEEIDYNIPEEEDISDSQHDSENNLPGSLRPGGNMEMELPFIPVE